MSEHPPVRPPGTVATFYSFKGGVGRTQSLVNVAVALAHNGFRVLIVDLDLLAPGVQTFPTFREALGDVVSYRSYESRPTGYGGVLDMVERQFREVGGNKLGDVGPDVWQHWIHRAYDCSGAARGYVDCLPAGPTDHRAIEPLAQRGWYQFLVDFGGLRLFERMRDELWRERYDFILVDSRTGLSDYLQFGVGTLPDVAVLVSALNAQNIEGMAAAIAGIEEVLPQRTIDLHVVPVLSLLPAGELDLLRGRLDCADRVWSSVKHVSHAPGTRQIRFISDPITLPYVGTLAMMERLVVPDEHDSPIFRQYIRIAEVLARHRFSGIDNSLNAAIYWATSGLHDEDVSDELARARSDSQSADYMYGRIRTEKLDGQRLVYMEKKDHDLSIECFETAIKLARERRFLAAADPWNKAEEAIGHWQVELEAMVFYGRVLADEERYPEAVAGFTQALQFLEHFERRNHVDIFSDRDWDAYAQEVLFTRAFCELGRLQAQLLVKDGERTSRRTLHKNLQATLVLFERLGPLGLGASMGEKLEKLRGDVERVEDVG